MFQNSGLSYERSRVQISPTRQRVGIPTVFKPYLSFLKSPREHSEDMIKSLFV